MSYNIVDHLHKIKVTLPIMEVMNIIQQKEKNLKPSKMKIQGKIE